MLLADRGYGADRIRGLRQSTGRVGQISHRKEIAIDHLPQPRPSLSADAFPQVIFLIQLINLRNRIGQQFRDAPERTKSTA
jgi:hypothetical protein